MMKVFSIFSWSKWQTIESNKRVMKNVSNPILGYESGWHFVNVDVQKRTNHKTGEVQYRNVER